MKAKMLYSLLCVSIALDACAPKKSASKDPVPAQSASAEDSAIANGSEHCTDKEASACFIEKDENGRSAFYTTKSYQEKWLTNPGIVKANIQMQQVSDEKYQDMLNDGLVPRMTYSSGLDINLNVLEENGQPKVLPGREANARLPAGGLAKNAGAFKKMSGVMKGGAGKGAFGKIFRKPGSLTAGKTKIGKGSIIGTLAVLLGLGGIVGGVAGAANNSKDGQQPSLSQIPVTMSFGGSSVSDELDVGE